MGGWRQGQSQGLNAGTSVRDVGALNAPRRTRQAGCPREFRAAFPELSTEIKSRETVCKEAETLT